MKNKFYTQGTLTSGTLYGGRQGDLEGGTWH